MQEVKQQIQEAITGFSKGVLVANALKLLNALGYESDRAVLIAPNNYQGFSELFQIDSAMLTPHIGSYAKEARIEMEIQSVRNLLSAI
jgi:D-3-phosphoglycerate dehydrogenase